MILIGWAENAIKVAGRPSKAKMVIRVRIILSSLLLLVCCSDFYYDESSVVSVGREECIGRLTSWLLINIFIDAHKMY